MSIKKWLKAAAAAVVISLLWTLLAGLGSGGMLNFVESPLRDLMRAKSDAERQPHPAIKIIKIDDYSLERIGQFPWDRSVYAELIGQLAEAGAEAIFLDIVLAEPGQNPDADAAMAEVMQRYPNVYLPVVFQLVERQEAKGQLETRAVLYPAPTIDAPRAQAAHINVMPDRDNTVRMLTIGLQDQEGAMVPAISVALANHLLEDGLKIRYDEPSGSWYRGDERIPLNSKSQVTIDFFTQPREQANADTGYDSQSFFSVWSGNIPAEYYEGEVVLIGPYTTGLQDEYYTPLSRTTTMFGVEIHANMVQSLVAGAFYFDTGLPVTAALILILTLLGLLLFELYPGRTSLYVYGGLFLVYAVVWLVVYQFFSHFISFTYPFLSLTTAAGWAVASHYMQERKERSRVTTIFGRFVPRSVVDEMLASGQDVKVGGQRRDISVIFVDIRGFTPMSERLQPEEVIVVLNEYLDLCTKAVFNWHGTLDKFIGDGVMAIFGAPVDLPDHAAYAVRAALEMKRQSDLLEQRCLERYGIGVKFGIGIHCGPAVVGNIGSEMLRLDYTAIGDTVNLSARLESNAKPGQILISGDLHERVQGRFLTEDIGPIKVKGKEQPVQVYAVLGETDTAAGDGGADRREEHAG